jgi:hypothetical protein
MDPTKKARLYQLSESEMMVHLIKYSEKCTKDPTKTIYPFVKHHRFVFWMNDRIRRHRTLSHGSW